jgi:hypothetical protein
MFTAIYYIPLFCGAEDQIQGVIHARQELYSELCSQSSSFLFFCLLSTILKEMQATIY